MFRQTLTAALAALLVLPAAPSAPTTPGVTSDSHSPRRRIGPASLMRRESRDMDPPRLDVQEEEGASARHRTV